MPKSKKKQQKAEDFKKVKLKVGKKKAPASNATDTSFTSKTIVLSGQSITADKGVALTNSRNLTLKDILSKLRHYSPVTRKEALAGLADLIAIHKNVLKTELGPIIEGSVRLIVDNEPAVRRGLLRVYSDILRVIPQRDLSAFASLMVVFTCSGMTHILEDIRGDAMKFLDLLAEVVPAAVAQHSATIMRNFFSLLETKAATAGNGGTSNGAGVNTRTSLLTQGNRLAIMRSCHNYLSVYTRPVLETGSELWFMGDADLNTEEQGYSAYFYPDTPAPFGALCLFGEASSGKSAAIGNSTTAIRAQSVEAFERLFPFLQETWMESATIFGTNAICGDRSLDLCALVLQIFQTLWRTAHPKSIPPTASDLVDFLRRCMAYFPFGEGFTGDSAAEETLLEMNLRVCELIALVRLGCDQEDGQHTSNKGTESDRWAKRATRFLLLTIGLKPAKAALVSVSDHNSKQTNQQNQVLLQETVSNPHLSSEILPLLLAALWKLAQSASRNDAECLLAAATHHVRKCPLASPSKTLGIRFLTAAIERQWSRTPMRGTLDLTPLKSVVCEWVLGLPKLMWQLRDRNLPASAAAADALRLVCQRTRLLEQPSLAALHASLVPLFCVTVPSKGLVYGPFRTYPSSLQRSVLEIVGCCSPCPPKLAQAIRQCTAGTSEDQANTDLRLDQNPYAVLSSQIRTLADEVVG
ncbi:rRNA processing protein [Coemansia erecta]|uniref:Pre-rRNA-processing protein n=1 Tax=Coemansia erecta TaxID=147472 RepID=A0A9W7XUX6_9FUNG|nr:rRNA processing protein [Coemansia erecta]